MTSRKGSRTPADLATAGLLLLLVGLVAAAIAEGARGKSAGLKGLEKKTKEYIGYFYSIPLNSAQREVRDTALDSLPAPCCKEQPMRICCCPCNFGKSVWGLSNFLIARKGYGVEQVRRAVLDWYEASKPNGFSGVGCYTGGCNRPFANDGCGGMDGKNPVF